MNVIGIALDELYRIFNILNKDKFDENLPEPVITIQKTKGITLGHFTVDKVWKDKKFWKQMRVRQKNLKHIMKSILTHVGLAIVQQKKL